MKLKAVRYLPEGKVGFLFERVTSPDIELILKEKNDWPMVAAYGAAITPEQLQAVEDWFKKRYHGLLWLMAWAGVYK